MNKKRFSTIFYIIGAIFCFVFFPIFLLDVGLESYIRTKNEVEEREAYRKLEINLNKVLQYSDAKYYYHSLLKKLFDIANTQDDPIKYLETAIPHLKQNNPDTFSFIVWDNKNENIIENLTDEKSHKYVLKTLNEVFTEITNENQENYPVDPRKNRNILKKINIIRSYLGSFLAAEGLLNPILRANLARIIPASANTEKSHFWFQANEKITMLVNINKTAIDSFSYIEKIISSLNKNSDDGVKYGIIDLLHDKNMISEEDESRNAELHLAFAKYENYSNSKLSSNNFLILIKILNPFVRAFCYIPKSSIIKEQSLRIYASIIALALISIFFLGIYLLYKYTNYNFSISWKLSLLFLYANGLPLLALSFIGYDYLQQNRNLQIEETYENISQLINDFDSKFETIKNQYTTRFDSIINRINYNLSADKDTEQLYKELQNEAEKTDCEDFMIIDKNSNIFINNNKSMNSNILKNIGENVLRFINNDSYTPMSSFSSNETKKKNESLGFFDSSVILDDIIAKKSKIFSEQVFNESNYYYINFIGNTEKRQFDYIAIISWQTHKLQENYINNHINSLNENNKEIKCLAFSREYGKLFPSNTQLENDLLNKFSQILNLNSIGFEVLNYKGKNYTAFGTLGRKLNQIAILGLYPLEMINKKTNQILLRLLIFILTSLILTISVSWFLSKYFLAPIKELRSGIEAMGKQKFTYRLPINSLDEFGSLNQVFNSALQSLEDLSVATTVQENLFPLEPLKQNNIFVWGKSVTMTRLGGDYFDYFPLNENEVGVLMGDVAGHGVPAGFLMAMAKATVILSEEDKKDPSKLLSAIHKVFYHVKSKKIKRMMTCIYFCLNSKTGDYTLANAGHCYPAIINNKKEVKFLEIDGTPLGTIKKANYTNIEGKMENNSYLLLYTDGMLEAHNESGESIGIQRFSEMITRSYSEKAEEFYNNLFNEYKKWSPSADDDITILFVKFETNSMQEKVENT